MKEEAPKDESAAAATSEEERYPPPTSSTETAAATAEVAAAEKPAEKPLEERVADYVRRCDAARARGRDAAERVNAELRRAEDAAAAAASLRKEGRRLRADVAKAKAQQQQLRRQVEAGDDALRGVRTQIAPATGGVFVEAVLGRMNCKLYREGERFSYKNDYERFKRRSVAPFLVMVAASFYWTHSAPLKCLLQMWSMFYFASLALRENILLANGSHIRRWWIVHHYLSALLSFVLLVWPGPTDTYQRFRPVFLTYTLGHLAVQTLQSQYQLARLYKMVALGKASPMDVTGEASPVHSWAPNVVVLYPFVTAVQLAQLYCAYRLLHMAWATRTFVEWYIPAAGAIFLVLGIGNIVATNSVYVSKWLAWKEHRVQHEKES